MQTGERYKKVRNAMFIKSTTINVANKFSHLATVNLGLRYHMAEASWQLKYDKIVSLNHKIILLKFMCSTKTNTQTFIMTR